MTARELIWSFGNLFWSFFNVAMVVTVIVLREPRPEHEKDD